MADLTSSSVSVTRTAYEIRSNNLTLFEKAATVTLATHGDLTAGQLIPASAFGLSTIEECSPLTKTDDTVVVVANPSNDKANLLLKAAGTNAPAAYSGAYKCVIRGY
jgi:hypothetical protein